MYYYIVDPQQLSQKEFERVQNVLYSSLSEFRISGEIVRVTGVRTIAQLVENAFAHEAKTIIAVGNDETLHETINAIGKRSIVVGFIPLLDSELGQIFGIGGLPQAVKTIAFRRIQEIDLGVVNDNFYFISKISFGLNENRGLGKMFDLPEIEISFLVDEKFQASQTVAAGLIINSRIANNNQIGNPTDGLLDILLLPQISKWNTILYRRDLISGFYENIPKSSIIHAKQITLSRPLGLPLKLGNKVVGRTETKITLAPKMLKMIVGRERKF
jgi:diacylglycerol kinase family enzyme